MQVYMSRNQAYMVQWFIYADVKTEKTEPEKHPLFYFLTTTIYETWKFKIKPVMDNNATYKHSFQVICWFKWVEIRPEMWFLFLFF